MKKNPIYVIAEAGVNHNGSLRIAKELVRVAQRAGADAVKFQTFRAESLVTKLTPKAAYQKRNARGSGQRDMLKALELSESVHKELFRYCAIRNIEFLSTPFDLESLRFLCGLGVKRIKISSGDLTHGPLLLAAARTQLPVILSTGMADLQEVRDAVAMLAFGYLMPVSDKPSCRMLRRLVSSARVMNVVRQKVTLLQCTTEYPAPVAEMNLRAMDTLQAEFGCAIGLSDHTRGIAVAIAAAARGATVIEKHFTLNNKMPGPDHQASLEPQELRNMIRGIRDVEAALGNGGKRVMHSERLNLPVARKALVAACSIRKGEAFTEENLTAKRAGKGISPMCFWDMLGKKSKKNYLADQKVSL